MEEVVDVAGEGFGVWVGEVGTGEQGYDGRVLEESH